MDTIINAVQEQKSCTSLLNDLFEWLLGSVSKRELYEYCSFNGHMSVQMPFEKKMVEVLP